MAAWTNVLLGKIRQYVYGTAPDGQSFVPGVIPVDTSFNPMLTATNPGHIALHDGAGVSVPVATPGDTFAQVAGLPAVTEGMLWDELLGQWVRERGNTDRILLAAAARTATVLTAIQLNYGGRGLILTLAITARGAASGGLTLTIYGADAGGNAYTLLTCPLFSVASGVQVAVIYPGVGAAGGGIAATLNAPLPRQFSVNVGASDATSYTYSLSAAILR